jgi:hypothetical protein
MEMKPIESEDIGCNPSSNASFEEVLESISRRRLLQSGLGALALGFLAGPRRLFASTAAVGFSSISVSQEDGVRVPPGYVSEVLYAWGDPVSAGPAWDPTAANTAEEQAVQAGMHHDAIHFFPLPYGSGSSTRGLLVMNHEYTDDGLLHVGGMSNWTPDKVLKSQAAHGVSVIEVTFDNGHWSVVRPSSYGRRITGYTPIAISGPAAGHALLRTSADPTGAVVKGTINNCAHGYTPWGTYLTCEENFNGYFVNGGTIPSNQARYGISAAGFGYRWHEHDGRFDASAHPNEPNRFGWVVEIDPFAPTSTPVKRTALGRIKHEGATVTLANDGRAVVYMADDERFEYIYKFVTRNSAPASGGLGASVLDHGTLYVGRFNPDRSGNWLELTPGSNGLDAAAGFPDQATVLINVRAAADKAGATKMDRPEWIAVHPTTKEVYVTLTNNSNRGDTGRPATDAANPRKTNVFGHIVRWKEDGNDPAASSFRWNVFVLAGDPRNTDANKKGNIKGDAFGSPDGLWFDSNGILWIQTDVSTSALNTGDYVNLGNNQMLAADVATGQIKRFLTGPKGCEVTGVIATPDMRSMFVNIQHPGEPSSERNDPRTPAAVSSWPDGPGIGRPRAATIVIRREDGGVIGT